MLRGVWVLVLLLAWAFAEEWHPGSFAVFSSFGGITSALSRLDWEELEQEDPSITPLHRLATKEGARREGFVPWLKSYDINVRTQKGETPLHFYARHNQDPRVARVLVDLGADVNAKDLHGNTPLHLAARTANPEVLRALVTLGARLEAKNDAGKTPFDVALEENPLFSVFQTFLELGVRLDQGALKRALLRSPNPRIVESILAEVECSERCRSFAFESRYVSSYELVLERLSELARGLKKKDFEDPLLFDGWFYSPDDQAYFARALCRHGFDPVKTQAAKAYGRGVEALLMPEAFDPGTYHLLADPGACARVAALPPSPAELALAIDLERPDMVNDLLARGTPARGVPRVVAPYAQGFNEPLDPLSALRIFWLLVVYGADVNERDAQGRTGLHWLAAARPLYAGHTLLYLDQAKLFAAEFLAAGADPNLLDDQGRTPLHIAMQNDEFGRFLTRLFLEHGADPDLADGFGRDGLFYWAAFDPQPLIRLTERGLVPRPNRRDRLGNSPLILASALPGARPRLETLKGLGADVFAENDLGQNALFWWALGAKDGEVLAWLKGEGVRIEHPDRLGMNPLHLYFQLPRSYARQSGRPDLAEEVSWLRLSFVGGLGPSFRVVPQVKALIKLGANPAQRDAFGRIPLHYLANRAFYPKDLDFDALVALLAPDPALVRAEDAEGNTPLSLARNRSLRAALERRAASAR